MTDTDAPDGPLARLRAQLAGPRGYRRIEALLAHDDAAAVIAQLAPNEIFELVHEVGFEDGQPLIELATPEQLQGCFDLDGWNRDQIDIVPLRPWITALIEAGYEKVGQVWGKLDAELRALIFQRQVKIYDVSLGEEPPEDSEAAILATPDRFFMIELPDEDEPQRIIQRLIEDLYRADADLARHTIMSARSEPPAELEEQSYRWRAARMADLGYVDFYEALDLFRPLPADQVHAGEGSQDRRPDPGESTHLPLVVAEEVVGRSFLARALGAIDDPAEAERLEAALVVLVNKVLAAGRARPGDAEVVKRGALYATATLSLGLEMIARGDLQAAIQVLRTVALSRLFRVGYTVTLRLAKLASSIADRSHTAGPPAQPLVTGLVSPRPLFARIADDPPQPGMRPFESQADLRRAGELVAALTVRIALVEGLGVDLVAMGRLPEPRPELDDHIRTALARAVAGGAAEATIRGEALSQAELAALRAAFDRAGKLSPAARSAGHTAITRRLGATQLAASGAIVTRLVDGWLDDLERILGTVKDTTIDPRFTEGLIVEASRS